MDSSRFVKIVAATALTLALSSQCYAEHGTLECINGNCEVWDTKYDAGSKYLTPEFNNISGVAQYNIKISILVFDIMDELVARKELKVDGPIFKFIKPGMIQIPESAYRFKYSINSSNEDAKKVTIIDSSQAQ